jgi:drug/metabolite transporter (DMT)-like permease
MSESSVSLGYSLVSLACLASAIGIVLTKRISDQVADPVIAFYLGLAAALCGTAGLFTAGKPSNPPPWEWFLALGSVVLSICCGQVNTD